MAAAIKVTYRKSAIGSTERQRATLRSLGLRRLGQSRIVPDTPVFRGMIERVRHLVATEPAELPDGSQQAAAPISPAASDEAGA